MSYNVEMTEVTGATFWKAYTLGQIAGTEAFAFTTKTLEDFTSLAELMQVYPPIDLYHEKLRVPYWIATGRFQGQKFPA